MVQLAPLEGWPESPFLSSLELRGGFDTLDGVMEVRIRVNAHPSTLHDLTIAQPSGLEFIARLANALGLSCSVPSAGDECPWRDLEGECRC